PSPCSLRFPYTTLFRSLAPRERVILGAGALVLILVLAYVLIWEPLAQQRQQIREDISALSADLAWMQQVAPQVRRRAAQQVSQPDRKSTRLNSSHVKSS